MFGLRPVTLVLALHPFPGVAQSSQPSLSGRVVDQAGQPVPGASIQVTSIDRKTTQAAATDANGRYAVRDLPAGQYSLTFSAMNFADLRRREVSVSPSTPARVDVTL